MPLQALRRGPFPAQEQPVLARARLTPAAGMDEEERGCGGCPDDRIRPALRNCRHASMTQSWSRSALQPGACRRCLPGVSNDEGQQTAFDARLDVRAGRTNSQRPRRRAAAGGVTHAPSGRALSVKGIAGSAARRASAMATSRSRRLSRRGTSRVIAFALAGGSAAL
jgi:hypothetical protein